MQLLAILQMIIVPIDIEECFCFSFLSFVYFTLNLGGQNLYPILLYVMFEYWISCIILSLGGQNLFPILLYAMFEYQMCHFEPWRLELDYIMLEIS